MHCVLRLYRALLLAVGLMVLGTPVSAELYKWTDAEGRVHFSDQPPPPEVRAPVTVKPRPPGATPAAPAAPSYVEQEAEFRKRQVEAAEKAKAEKQTADDAAEKQRNCDQARARVASLEIGGRITRTNAAGEQIFLTDAEIAQALSGARRDADAACK